MSLLLAVGCMEEPSIEYKGLIYDRLDESPKVRASVRSAQANASEELEAPEFEDGRVVYGYQGPALHEWDREELALALRPTLYLEGQGYVAREPWWGVADEIIAQGDSPGEPFIVTPRDRSGERTVDTEHSDVGRGHEELIFGTDDRTLSNTTQNPFRAFARILTSFPGGGSSQCSGGFIGPWTFLTAAHCLRNSSGVTATSVTFDVARQGSSQPNPSVNCSFNNMAVAIPAGFTGTTSGDDPFDYAVIDTYPCTGAPSGHFINGYMANAPNGWASIWGYPGPSEAPCPTGPHWTSQCGMSGSWEANGHRFETATLDTSSGQSGSTMHRFGSTDYLATGILTGWRSYFDLGKCGFDLCYRNVSRRIDSGVDAFIKASSFDF